MAKKAQGAGDETAAATPPAGEQPAAKEPKKPKEPKEAKAKIHGRISRKDRAYMANASS